MKHVLIKDECPHCGKPISIAVAITLSHKMERITDEWQKYRLPGESERSAKRHFERRKAKDEMKRKGQPRVKVEGTATYQSVHSMDERLPREEDKNINEALSDPDIGKPWEPWRKGG